MVCKSCEKKLSKAAATDPFRNRNAQGTVIASGSAAKAASTVGPTRRTGPGAVTATAGAAAPGPSNLGKNKLLGAKGRYSPLGNKCKICGTTVQQERGTYCQGCAYKRGICSICGKQIMDTRMHKMSST